MRSGDTGRSKAGLEWAKYNDATHPPEKEPPYPVVDGPGAISGRELLHPRDQTAVVG